MAVRVLAEDSQFNIEMNAAGTKLVVVDFTAAWYVFCLEKMLKVVSKVLLN